MMVAELRVGINETDPRGTWALGHAGGNMVAGHGAGGDANGPNPCNDKSDDLPASSGIISFSCNAQGSALRDVCMTCNDDSFGFAQAAPRSSHFDGIFIAHADGSVAWISNDIETGGEWGGCCKTWDNLIMSADSKFKRLGLSRP
jgi:hypothetical protein